MASDEKMKNSGEWRENEKRWRARTKTGRAEPGVGVSTAGLWVYNLSIGKPMIRWSFEMTIHLTPEQEKIVKEAGVWPLPHRRRADLPSSASSPHFSAHIQCRCTPWWPPRSGARDVELRGKESHVPAGYFR